MSTARRDPSGLLSLGRALGAGTFLLTLLSACTLDITDVDTDGDGDPVGVGSSPPGLSLHIELDVDEPETGLARVEIEAYFLAGTDGEGRPRTITSLSSLTLGSLTLDPEVDRALGHVRWRGDETMPIEGDTLRFTPPVIEGFAPFPEIVVPVGLELDPAGNIELAPGSDIELAARFFDDRVVDSGPVQDRWSLNLGNALSVSGRGAPPTIRLPGELVDGVELPADLRLRSSRGFMWEQEAYGAYFVQLMRSVAVRLTVTPSGSDP